MGIFVSKNKAGANANKVDDAVLKYLDDAFQKLHSSEDCHSLLKKHLTRSVFDQVRDRKTKEFGSTLKDVIQSGVANLDSGIGVYAPDAESYVTFAPLFDPIISDYHNFNVTSQKHPPSDFRLPDATLENLDPSGRFIVSTRIRCGRSLQGFPFNPNMSEDDYTRLEEKVSEALGNLEGELKGQYYSLAGMEEEQRQELLDGHFLFKEGDRFLEAANACRFWPKGRGIFLNEDKTFLVWCGEEDHLRIISMQQGGDVGEVFGRLCRAVDEISKSFSFYHDDRLGFLTFCPTNLGTTIRASVHIRLPKLAADGGKDALQEVGDKYQLQVRGSAGEHSDAVDGLYDISNRERMGLTELEAVQKMYDGIKEMIEMECQKEL